MGLSSKTNKSSTKPIYSAEITGAAGNVTNAYNAQAPKITEITDQLGDLTPGLLSRFTNGDPTVNAAQGYAQSVLGGQYLGEDNPYLGGMINQTNNSITDRVQAAFGKAGRTGSGANQYTLAKALGENENALRYGNYAQERQAMTQAAGMAPQLSAAQYLPIGIVQQIAQSQQMPVQTAAGAGSAVGGLLGQYTNQKQTYNPSIMDGIAQALNVGKAAAGFF